MKILATFLLLLTVSLAEKVRFDGYKVHRVTPQNEESLEKLRALEDESIGYDFWSGVKRVGDDVDVMVPPHLEYKFVELLAGGGFDHKVFIDDVQELIDTERPAVRSTTFSWSDYQTLDQINNWLRSLAASDSRVTLIQGGTSYEGRPILGVHVVFAPGNQNRSVFLESTIHAREWITAATTTWILNQLLTSTDRNVRQIADTHDWYVFPVFNPDGYVYSHTTNRMWRKTRVPYVLCAGADPNRNWGYYFNSGGSSSNPCSETYAGPRAFSEPSTRSMSEFITSVAPRLRAYIALHSYSQYLLLPYGFSNAKLDNYQDLYSVGLRAAASLASRYNTQYRVGNIVDLLYVASGGSMDWVKGTFGTPITYTYELRDTGRFGFILPAAQIVPTAEETLDSLVTILQGFNNIL